MKSFNKSDDSNESYLAVLPCDTVLCKAVLTFESG